MLAKPSSSSRDNVLSERNLNSMHRSNSNVNGTLKPVPPPKPSHLSSVFTGTLNSDALKSYIKQHSQRLSVISTNTITTNKVRNRNKNVSSNSQYATDTFRTSRESSAGEDDEEDEEMASWGTARQSPSPLPGKLGLADIFAPLSIPGGELMRLDTKSTFTVRPEPKYPSAKIEESKILSKSSSSSLPLTNEDDDDVLVPTIKLGKNESIGFMIGETDNVWEEDRIANKSGHPSRTCSSDEGTIRSREPSILSRLSTFEDDFDEEEQQLSVESGIQIEQEQTPKKNWMHARDGSAFERASPRNLKIAVAGGSTMNNSKHLLERMSEVEKENSKSGLPVRSHGLPMMVAGPPPIRPKSVAVDLTKETDLSVKTPTQEKTESESLSSAKIPTLSIASESLKLCSSTQLEVNQTSINKSNLSSRRREVERGTGKPARALYEFQGEPRFNELNLAPGQVFEILKEDVQDGWSLAAAEQSNIWTKGLIPQGWYTYIQEFTVSPNQNMADIKNDSNGKQSESKNDNGNSLVVPMIRSHSSISSQSGSVNQDEHVQIRSRQEGSRPASGIGQMSTSFAEAKGAIQILTQMKRNSETGSISPPNLFNSSSNIRTASGSRIVQHPIREASTEEVESADPTTLILNHGIDYDTTFESSDQSNSSNIESEITQDSSIETNTSSDSSNIPNWRLPGMFGGRSLNRFTPFVTSGAEKYILSNRVDTTNKETRQNDFNISSGHYGGPAWKHEGINLIVEVHSPEVHTDDRGKLYTAYVVHTSYILSPEEREETQDLLMDPFIRPEEPSMTSSVYRRFNQFRWLNDYLQKYYPTIMFNLPPMPSINEGAGRSTRFDEIFVERRRRHLQSWLCCIVRQPIFSKDVAVRFFLEAEEEGDEWFALTKEIVKQGELDSSTFLFSHTFHPMFNFDVNEAELESKRMSTFHEVYERCLSNSNEVGMTNSYKNLRGNFQKSGEMYRQVSLSILRLITGTDGSNNTTAYMTSPSRMLTAGQAVLPPMGNVGRRGPNGATNEDRAWCWREGCLDCRKLTNAMQITAEGFQIMANEYQSHSDGNLFEIHDKIYNLTKPNQQQQALLDVHKNALTMYRLATGEKVVNSIEDNKNGQDESHLHSQLAERIASRSETVLNVTMSEMDRLHNQRVQDWNAISRQMLDEQIAFYKDILHNLENTRNKVDEALGVSSSASSSNHTSNISDSSNESSFSIIPSQTTAQGPLLPSPYEVQLTQPIIQTPLEMPNMQLTEPSAASKAIRPVALASEVFSEWLGGNHSIIR